jgi:predicted nucleic acid-binding protein
MTKQRPAIEVEQWLESVDDTALFLSVISLSEILRGVHRLPSGARRLLLEQWMETTLRPWFAGRILPITEPIAERAGRLAGEQDRKGRPLPFADGLIAATALEHELVVVTRNVSDFDRLGVQLINPWE